MRTLLTFVLFVATLVASSALNNLPATLLVRSVLGALQAQERWMHAALLGTNIGSCLTPHGTLATLPVLGAAARRGADLPPLEVVKVSLRLVPAMLLAGLLGLWVVPWRPASRRVPSRRRSRFRTLSPRASCPGG